MYRYDEVYNETLKYFNNDDLAANVFVTKYALKDNNGNFIEKTPDDMHKRLSGEFSRIETTYGGKTLAEQEIYDSMKDFKYIVAQGSPSYGIGNNYVLTSLSNCLVVRSPEDSMSSIFEVGKQLANLFKARAGVGLDLSTLRPEGSRVSNAAGTSSGAWSFADLYSHITRLVGQAGRRGALILTMDVRHPDIDKFVVMKKDLKKVTGANISVRISDDFMKAVENDSEFCLKFPIDSEQPKVTRIIRAKELWDLIVKNATENAEPGILFWDTIKRRLPAESYADVGFKTISTNPCSEIPLSEFDSCRLISINLKNFVRDSFTRKASFDFDLFKKMTAQATRLGDDLVDLEIEKIDKIISRADDSSEKKLWGTIREKGLLGRRIGIGTHALADALARLGVSYDSTKAIEYVDQIYNTLKVSVYGESINLAKERGAFPIFDWNREKDNDFIKDLPDELLKELKKYGRRNIALLTNAPTGSISILCQTSSGIEPVFKNSYVRRKKLNPNDVTEGYEIVVDDLGDKWISFDVFHQNVKEWMELTGKRLDELPKYFIESHSIDWDSRVELQSVAQKHIDHSISSTINLPKGIDTGIVDKLYFDGWKKNLKGITVYVDGSRSGVLVAKKSDCREAPKRPDMLDCQIHHVSVKGQKWLILVGILNGKPYEIFGGIEENIEIPRKFTVGKIIKIKEKNGTNRYDLCFGEGELVKNIAKVFDNTNYQVHTRLISLGLRHGAKPNFLVEQLLRDSDNDLTSFSRAISRVLKKYIEDGTRVTSDKICSNCGQESLVYQDGCVVCKSCGYSKCS